MKQFVLQALQKMGYFVGFTRYLSNIQFDLQKIIEMAYDSNKWRSLFTFKPTKIIKFNVIDCSFNERIDRKKEILLHRLDGRDSLVEDIPYKFSYTFVDAIGKISTLQLLDWEIYQLARKLIRVNKNNFSAISNVLKNKYFNEIACKRDVYFFLGSNKYWHIRKSKNPFMILILKQKNWGVFPKLIANTNRVL